MDLRGALCVPACVLLVGGCLWAGERASIEGEVRSSGPLSTREITIELVDTSHGRPVTRTSTSGDGRFEFDGIPTGLYEVRAVDQGGHILRQEFVDAMDAGTFVVLQLPALKPPERPVSGTVSVSALRHNVPGKAEKEFRKSMEALQSGDAQKSVAHLQKAVEIDPDFMQAHNNLGSRYFAGRDYEKALGEFQKALALEPDSEPVRANVALTLMALGKYPDAEKAARSALKLGHSPKACLALGVSLKEQWRGISEAVGHLNHAVKEFPRAYLIIAEILANEGQRQRAAEEVQAYLAVDRGGNHLEAQRWLEQLNGKPATEAGSAGPTSEQAGLDSRRGGEVPAN